MDRQFVAQKVRKPLDEITSDLRDLYESGLKKGLHHVWVNPDGTTGGKHQIFIEIGESLVDYIIDEKYERMSDLIEDFNMLGWCVGYLVHTYNDRGLSDEECIWLGKEGLHVAQAGKISYEPSDHLKTKPVISECNTEELVKLFDTYFRAKGDYFTKKSDYGNSVDKIFKGE